MKKITLLLVLTLCLTAVFAGCAQMTEDSPDQPEAFPPFPEGTETWKLGDAGFEVAIPDVCLAYADRVYFEPYGTSLGGGLCGGEILFLPASEDELMAMEEEEIAEINENGLCVPLIIFGIDGGRGEEELRSALTVQGILAEEDSLHRVGAAGDWTFFRTFSDKLDAELEGEMAEIYAEIRESLGTAELRFFVPDFASAAGSTVSFSTATIDGDPVNSADLFAGSRLTLVNLWASWCGPCAREMPELEALSQQIREKGGAVIGILWDADDPGALADGRAVLETAGVTFPILKPTAEIFAAFPITAYPTTYFIDSEGKIVGSPIIGADVDGYRRVMEEYLESEE